MTQATEMDLVGCLMTVTLTNGTVLSGTVFTYVPENEILVLVTDASLDTQSFKVVRTTFIKSFTVDQEVKNIPASQRLPQSLDAYEQLPAVSKNVRDWNAAKKFLIAEEKSREKKLGSLCDSTPVGAADLFLGIARVYPNTKWSAEDGTLTMEDIVVVGEPDWAHPVVKTIGGQESANKERVENLIKKILSTTE